MRWKKGISLLLAVGCLWGASASESWAQDEADKEEIIKMLTIDQPEEMGRGALPSRPSDKSLFGDKKKSGRKGIKDIAEDTNMDIEKELEKANKVSEHILFDYNSDIIQAKSKKRLDMYADIFANALQDALIVIAGHTDTKGSAEYNLELSKRRAKAVMEYLINEHQLDSDRFKVKGYGEEKPIQDANDEENRRVEFLNVPEGVFVRLKDEKE